MSVREQEEQESKKPDTQRHMSLHLDGQLTVQTKRRFLYVMPSNPEDLRVKFKIMTNCWLLAQTRQPGPHLYADFTRMTFVDFLDELLSERNFLMGETIGRTESFALIGLCAWVLSWGYDLKQSNIPAKEACRFKKLCGRCIATITIASRTSPIFSASRALRNQPTKTKQCSHYRKSGRFGKANPVSVASRS